MPGNESRLGVRPILLILALALPACNRPKTPSPVAAPLAASPRAIIGHILAIDLERAFAFVDIAGDAPAAALAEGAELTARTLDLRETGQLRASRYLRGKTLGAKILSGQPTPGDEVVWRLP